MASARALLWMTLLPLAPAAGQASLSGTEVSLPPTVAGALRLVALPGNRVAVWSTDSAAGVLLDRGANRTHRLNARDGGGYAIRRNSTLSVLADTVVAQDVSNGRWVFLPANGGRGRSAVAPTGPLNENNIAANRAMPLADGKWLFVPQNDTASQPVQVGNATGGAMRRIGSFRTPSEARVVIAVPNVGTINTTVPFAAGDRVYVSPDGRQVMLVGMPGGRPGAQVTVSIRVMDLDGREVSQAQVPLTVPADATTAIPAWKTNLLNGIPANFRSGFDTGADEAMASFAHFAPFVPLGWLGDGGLWGRGATQGGATTWLRLDPASGAQRQVTLPEGCALLDVSGGAAWWSCTADGKTTVSTGAL